MACNCSKSKSAIAYEVTFASGESQTYPTVGEAQQAGIDSGGAFTFKAVAKKVGV